MAVHRRIIPTLIALGATTLCAACGSDDPIAITPGADPGAPVVDATGGESPNIVPHALVVHPLTRIGLDARGQSALLLHLEIKDQFGQTIKALGRVRVELYRPGDAGGGGAQQQDRVWDADLSDPARNALMFDSLITRTYVLPLGGLPEWLVEWSRGEGNIAPTITVAFTTRDGGADRTLRAGFRLSR